MIMAGKIGDTFFVFSNEKENEEGKKSQSANKKLTSFLKYFEQFSKVALQLRPIVALIEHFYNIKK